MCKVDFLAGAAVLLACGALLAGASWSENPEQITQPAARRVFLDPDTGKPAPPTDGQRRAARQRAAAQRVTGPQEGSPRIVHRDGMTIVTVPRAQWPLVQATTNRDRPATPGASDE
ncbi:MAG: hypothetical protein L0H83_01270 [Salinisphaera sp.]|nr:hypothetical protein [Salinisphaera sp.]